MLLETRLIERRAEFGPIAQRLADEATIGGVTINGKRSRTPEVNILGETVVARAVNRSKLFPSLPLTHRQE